MYEKKAVVLQSPDITRMREVIIDHRTRIYIAFDADIEEAKNRYLYRNTARRAK